MTIKLAGVKRQTDYSPNHIENDTLIIQETAAELKKLGANVTIYDEADVPNINIEENFIFSMAQGPNAVEKLIEVEKSGKIIINTPRSVSNCYRTNMTKNLPLNNIPFPKSITVDTNTDSHPSISEFDSDKIWIKRGDVHAVHREDVTLVYNDAEKNTLLREFAKRGISKAILQEHIDGDVIKFYAIREEDYFHWYYLNGKYHTEFNLTELKNLAMKSAEVLELFIYGGDAIVSPDGKITIIDINDWPSFAPVRNIASKLIAKLIYRKSKEI